MKHLALLVFAVLAFGCLGPEAMTVEEIEKDPEAYLGEKVLVKGTVRKSFKIGKLSGFHLQGENESMLVSSELLPPEGSSVEVHGTVMREAFVGYYLLAKDIDLK
ncbi:hypothetical protein GF318_02715 [Candidatus Micrarchaeota archaeon]|nr:hypothetical protein [Candidatus Micrarchaeota archaeon]